MRDVGQVNRMSTTSSTGSAPISYPQHLHLTEGTLHGSLVAHEVVNRDIERSIDVTVAHIIGSAGSVDLLDDPSSSVSPLMNDSDLLGMGGGQGWSSKLRSVDEGKGGVHGRDIEGGRSMALSQYRMLSKDKAEGVLTSSMVVSPIVVDLSDVYVGEVAESSFEVVNSAPGDFLSFIVMNPSAKQQKGGEV
jgi:hypothetical protein